MSVIGMNALLAVAVGLLLVASPQGAYAAFAVLGVASGLNRTGVGAAWGHTYGVERLGELQGVGEAARIGAAAFGPLPLAVALSLTGGYAAGLLAMLAVAALCALLGTGFGRTARASSRLLKGTAQAPHSLGGSMNGGGMRAVR
jgi:hypothetical protein